MFGQQERLEAARLGVPGGRDDGAWVKAIERGVVDQSELHRGTAHRPNRWRIYVSPGEAATVSARTLPNATVTVLMLTNSQRDALRLLKTVKGSREGVARS